eukprot:3662065-Pyramimonas_sp.AAC.1
MSYALAASARLARSSPLLRSVPATGQAPGGGGLVPVPGRLQPERQRPELHGAVVGRGAQPVLAGGGHRK